MNKTFKAKFSGDCVAECGEDIALGDEVKWGYDGIRDVVIHAGCDMVPAELKQPGKVAGTVCTECWETRAVSGACACGL